MSHGIGLTFHTPSQTALRVEAGALDGRPWAGVLVQPALLTARIRGQRTTHHDDHDEPPAAPGCGRAARGGRADDGRLGRLAEVPQRRSRCGTEPDTQDASGLKADEVNLFVDLAYNLIAGAGPARGRAGNVNTVDEVPDSSWFTNRAGARPLTALDVANGPDTTDGPAAGPWTITLVEERRRDARASPSRTATGSVWFLKFDPARLPRHGHRHRGRGDEVDVGARLQRAREPHRLRAARAAGRRRRRATFTPQERPQARDAPRRHRRAPVGAPIARPTAATASWRARRSRASRSAASASSARGPTTRTTSCRTRIAASCAATACSPPGSTTWTPRPSTRSTRW